MHFWTAGDRSAWILDEVGKEQPITAGIVIRTGKVESVEILQYRESRGWEIQMPSFLRQFRDAGLADDELDRDIDNISGATLSVHAVQRMVKLALYLDAHRD